MPSSIDPTKAQALRRIIDVAGKANIRTDVLDGTIYNQVMNSRNPLGRAEALEKAYQKGLLSPTLKQRAEAYPELAGVAGYLSVFGEVEISRHFNAILYHNSPSVLVDVIADAGQGNWLKGELGEALKTELLKTKQDPRIMFNLYKTAYDTGLLSGVDASQVVKQLFAHQDPARLNQALLQVKNQSLYTRAFGVKNASDVIAHPNPQAYIQATQELQGMALFNYNKNDVVNTLLKTSREPIALAKAIKTLVTESTPFSEDDIKRLAARTDIAHLAEALEVLHEGSVPISSAFEKLLSKYGQGTTQYARELVAIHKEYRQIGVKDEDEIDHILAQRNPERVREALKHHHNSTFFKASNEAELRDAIIEHNDSDGLATLIAKLKVIGYPVHTLNDTDKQRVLRHPEPREAADVLASAYQAGLFNMSFNNYLRAHASGLSADVLAYVGYFNFLTNQVKNQENLHTLMHARNPEAFTAMIAVMGNAGLLSGAKGQQHFEELSANLNRLCGRGNRLLPLWSRVPADLLTEEKWNRLMTTINLSVISESQKSSWVENYIQTELAPAPAATI